MHVTRCRPKWSLGEKENDQVRAQMENLTRKQFMFNIMINGY